MKGVICEETSASDHSILKRGTLTTVETSVGRVVDKDNWGGVRVGIGQLCTAGGHVRETVAVGSFVGQSENQYTGSR